MIFSVVFLMSIFTADLICSRFLLTPNDRAFPYRYTVPQHTYHRYCKNVYSQNGEDGIVEQLIKELGIKQGTFCEFGASDSIKSSNTYNLIKNYNFSGLAIESDRSKYERCVENYRQFPHVQVYHGAVLYNDVNNDLNAWLKRGGLLHDFDILSIDIDCDDYYVWEGLTDFMPKIVIFETNSYREPVSEELPHVPHTDYDVDLLKEWQSDRVAVGCSFIAGVTLGLKKGYIPVAYTGNITFVRKDLVRKLQEFPYKISDNPYDYVTLYTHLVLWDNRWMTNTGLILNVALRDHYLIYNCTRIDIDWLNRRMHEILTNEVQVASIPYTIVKGEEPIVIDPAAEMIGHTWSRSNGVWEQHLIQKFYALIPHDEPCVVFDLGAQTGAFSLMANYFPLSVWYSFEPIEEAAMVLKQNLTLNHIENVFIQQVAVADYMGTTTLKMPDRANWGLSTIGSTLLRFTSMMTRQVPVIDLDSFVEQRGIARVHFMKLDTEGSEYYILRGAKKMLMRDHPIIIMEYNEINMRQCGVCKEELNALLAELGYTWHMISTEDILCMPN